VVKNDRTRVIGFSGCEPARSIVPGQSTVRPAVFRVDLAGDVADGDGHGQRGPRLHGRTHPLLGLGVAQPADLLPGDRDPARHAARAAHQVDGVEQDEHADDGSRGEQERPAAAGRGGGATTGISSVGGSSAAGPDGTGSASGAGGSSVPPGR
jgi:hypothetical protein